jgi:hypothetical protein
MSFNLSSSVRVGHPPSTFWAAASFRDLAGRGHIVATTSKWDWLASFDFIRPNRVEDSVFLHGLGPFIFP